ncbi:MAG: glycosyltransferase family 87 protein [Pirellulaceae bacterium]
MAPATLPRTPDEVLAERMQFLGQAMLVLFLAGWFAGLFPFDDLLDRCGTPLGADYSMFYVAGQVVLDGAADRLYDQAEHQQRLHALFPGLDNAFCLPYRYPPFVAVLMAPLAALPYPISYGCFLLLSCLAWASAIWLMTKHLRILRGRWRRPVLWAIAGWPLAWETLMGGQASMFAMLILSCSFVLVRARRWVSAGAVLALAAYKPNVLAFVALGIVLRYPRMLKGAIPIATLLGLFSLFPAGWKGWNDYMALSSQLALQPWNVATPYWKVHGIASWLAMLPGENERVCSLVLGAALAALVAWFWRSSEASETTAAPLAIGALVSVNALFNPYTPIYDLSLLMVGSLLTAESLARRYGASVAGRLGLAQVILATIYFGPHLSQVTSQWIAVQPFSLALLVLFFWQLRHFGKRGRSSFSMTDRSLPMTHP